MINQNTKLMQPDTNNHNVDKLTKTFTLPAIIFLFLIGTLVILVESNKQLLSNKAKASEIQQNLDRVTPISSEVSIEFGPVETVYDWSVDKCQEFDFPDFPARAIVDINGNVQLYSNTAAPNRKSIGTNLSDQKHDCRAIFNSHFDPNIRNYNSTEFLVSPYTLDGQNIYSLVHTEYHGEQFNNCHCALGDTVCAARDCWWTSVNLASSTDAGYSFSHKPVPSHNIANTSIDYDPNNFLGPIGFFEPSNIVSKDGFMYSLILKNTPQKPSPGTTGDVNGDGKEDIVVFGDNGVYVALSNSSILEASSKWTDSFSSSQGWGSSAYPRLVTDVNGDNKSDLVGFGQDGVYVALSNGSGFEPIKKWTNDFNKDKGWISPEPTRTTGDINNDNKSDLVGFGQDGVYVALSNGSGFGPIKKWIAAFDKIHGWTNERFVRTTGDVNGDGLDDLVGFGQDGVYVALSNGSGFGPIKKWILDFGLMQGWTVDKTIRSIGDINNDGLSDLVGFASEGVYVSLSSGTAFLAPSKWLNGFGSGQGWTTSQFVRTVGDVNGDGNSDLIGFGLGGIFVSTSSGTTLNTVNKWINNLDKDVSSDSAVCLMRTDNLADPLSWRLWNGSGFTQSPQGIPKNGTCTPTGAASSFNLSFNNYLESYMTIGCYFGKDCVFQTSKNMLQWDTAQALSDMPFNGKSLYGSLLQPGDSTRNFEQTDRSPWLYFVTCGDSQQCQSFTSANRDLKRVRVRFSKPDDIGKYEIIDLRFNEWKGIKTLDSGFYGNNGTLSGGPVFAKEADKSFVRFNGLGEVTVPHHSSLNASNIITIRAKFKTSMKPSAFPVIVRKVSSISNYGLYLTPLGKLHFHNMSGAKFAGSISNASVNDGLWHDVFVTFDSATGVASYYIDGKLDSQTTHGGRLSDGLNSAVVTVGDDGFTGDIDQLTIYNYEVRPIGLN